MNCMYQSGKESWIAGLSSKCDQQHRYSKEEKNHAHKQQKLRILKHSILYIMTFPTNDWKFSLSSHNKIYNSQFNLSLYCNKISKREYNHTTGSGASHCWHIIQGTPVFWDTAIFAAHKAYFLPSSL